MSDDAPIPAPRRTIALVGLMGVGKSTVGRRLARRLHLPFADGDAEIEAAAGMTVSEIFAELGEPEFRPGSCGGCCRANGGFWRPVAERS